MKITYNKDADALYIRGIEVLGAHRLFSEPDRPAIDLRDILPRVVAA